LLFFSPDLILFTLANTNEGGKNEAKKGKETTSQQADNPEP
jgi:hypothetical protein